MGCLWGLAFGDVLGCPVEGFSADEIATAYGTYAALPSAYPEAVPRRRRARLRPLGLHSDDTQQALALLSVCLSGWSPASWARCLVEGARKRSWRGTGRRFDSAVQKLAQGSAPQVAGSPSAGIGAAMRVAPLGALYHDQSRKLAEVAMESSAVTHADLRSIVLAYAIAWTCAQLINGKSAAEVRRELPDAVAEGEDEWLHGRRDWNIERSGRHQVSLGLARVLAAMPEDVTALGALVMKFAEPLLPPMEKAHPNHAFALLGGVYGLVSGLVIDVDPMEALLVIVRQGEDTDTVAAIAGGVLGARYGGDWVPKEQLQDRAHIELYARALVARGEKGGLNHDGVASDPKPWTPKAPETLDTFLQREAALSAQEKTYQAESRWPR